MEYRTKARLTVLLGLATLVLGPWAWGYAAYRYGYADSWLSLLAVDGDATVWADGFRHGAWRRVQPGATREDVLRTVGEPLDAWPGLDDGEVWSFTRQSPPPTRNIHERKLVFDRSGRVVSKRTGVFVD